MNSMRFGEKFSRSCSGAVRTQTCTCDAIDGVESGRATLEAAADAALPSAETLGAAREGADDVNIALGARGFESRPDEATVPLESIFQVICDRASLISDTAGRAVGPEVVAEPDTRDGGNDMKFP